MAEHAPTPWRVERRYSNGCECCPEIWAGNDWIAVVTGSLPHLLPAAHAKAEQIVRAVNLYDELVAAMKHAAEYLHDLVTHHQIDAEEARVVIEPLDDVLAKVETTRDPAEGRG